MVVFGAIGVFLLGAGIGTIYAVIKTHSEIIK
jgi:hypothetical protein